ncbi:MAG: GAF domain-containing protein, partial [Chloroflexi bacterium]|nr:GAF domain-containing protein [Chloroflexota bacterium]
GCDRVSLALLDPGGASFHIAAVDNGLPGLEKGRRLPVTATSAGLDLLAGRPHLTPDIAAELGLPAEQAVYAAGYRSRMSVPLLVGERVSGALNLQWRDAEGFDTAHLPLLAQIADAIALAVENAQLFESVARERGRLELVSMISQELAANLDQRAVAENALRLVTGALDAFAGSLANAAVFTIESGSDRLELIAATGVARDRLEEIDRAAHLRIGEGLVGWSAANRRIAIASDVDLDERWRYVPDIDQGVKSSAAVPLLAGTELVGVLSLTSSATGAFTPEHHPLLIALATPLALALQNARLFAAERERVRNLTLQTEVSRALADSMNLDDLLPAVSKYLAAIVDATGAAVVVWDAERQTVLPAASYGETTVSFANLQPEPGEPSLAEHVIRTGQPAIIEDASRSTFIGARFAERLSDKSLLGVPLIARGRTIGAALIGESRRLRLFTPEELDRVMGLAGQIALAVDNAQLFTSLGRHLSQILEMKQLQDNVFASIAAGVVTTEADGKVSLVNPAAERILGLPAIALVGQPAQVVLSALGESILSLAEVVRKFGVSETGHEVTINYPLRGTVHLNVSLTPLPGADGKGAGVTFVLEDVTEQRRLEIDREHIRRTFERVVPPGVVETLLADSANLQLGGRRQEITIMFADVRGFTSFAEQTAPEALIDVLNAFLDVAAQAVLEQGGTIDKFLGDGVMAIFNAPLPQAAHTLHAVRAAVRMRDALSPHRNLLEKTFPLNFSIGIAVGEAVVGNIGTSALFNYTAVGDIVNLAKRLQENAAGGQILLNEMAYQHVGDFVEARPLQPLRVKGRTALEHVYEVVRVERMVVR